MPTISPAKQHILIKKFVRELYPLVDVAIDFDLVDKEKYFQKLENSVKEAIAFNIYQETSFLVDIFIAFEKYSPLGISDARPKKYYHLFVDVADSLLCPLFAQTNQSLLQKQLPDLIECVIVAFYQVYQSYYFITQIDLI
jgi:hypothetical protein